MVILPASEFARLMSLAEDAEDIVEGRKILVRVEGGEGTMPGAVLDMILDENLHPVAAWRRYRRLSQAELARNASLSQVWVSRIERGGGYGSRTTRQRLAEALEAPLWALDEETGPEPPSSRGSGKGRKYAPLRERLAASGAAAVSLSFDEISALVGGLPPSATKHREWWANHQGNSQAHGWMPAGYRAEPDLARGWVAFRRAG